MKVVSRGWRQTTARTINAGGPGRRSMAPGRSVAILLGLAAAASAVAASPGAASASTYTSPVVGHVYVDDNTAGTNTIGAFNRHADGTLTPEAGSPFVAGGAGTGAGLASQGALQISPDGRFLIAVDAGSNQISVLRVNFDGSLQLVGSPVPSGGILPVSVAIHDDLVYVANSGAGGTNYTGFRLGFDGRLEPVPGSTVTLPAGSQPGDVLFNSFGRNLVGTRIGTSMIDSFTVGFNGLLPPRRGPRSPPRALARSAASSARRTRASCLCPTPTTWVPAQGRSRRSTTPSSTGPVVDRALSVPGPADSSVLGGDHP